MLSTRQPLAEMSRIDPLWRNWSRWTKVLGMVTENRRCLRVTIISIVSYGLSGCGLQPLQKPGETIPF